MDVMRFVGELIVQHGLEHADIVAQLARAVCIARRVVSSIDAVWCQASCVCSGSASGRPFVAGRWRTLPCVYSAGFVAASVTAVMVTSQ